IVGTTRDGFPVLGNRRLLLLVTPQCSELEAITALWLLCGAVVCSRWGDLHKTRAVIALLVGTAVLYLLIALRIYGLVVVGIAFSPNVCVSLAHSRIGSIFFLGFAALVAGCCHWYGTQRARRANELSALAAE